MEFNEFIVEAHNRPPIREYWIDRSEPDFDLWFTIKVEKGKPVFREMQQQALEIINSELSGTYEPSDISVLNRTIDRNKISPENLVKLRQGLILPNLLSQWDGHKYVR